MLIKKGCYLQRFALDLHLLSSETGCVSGIENLKLCFNFPFHSTCTIFAKC